MEIHYFKYLAYTILCYLVTYIAGSVLHSFFGNPEKNFENEFKKNVLGIWLVIVLYSIVLTKGVTLSLGILILAIFWAIYNRPKIKFQWSFYPRAFLFSIVLLLLFYTLLYFDFYDPVSRSFYYYSMDLPVYASMVEKINVTGLESKNIDLFSRIPLRELYHYGDLWLAAFFVRLFGLNAMQTVYFIYTAIGAMVISVGALALAQQVTRAKRVKPYHVFMAVCFIALSGISMYIKKVGFFSARWGDEYNLLGLFKTYLATHSLIWASILLMKRDIKNMTLVLLVGIVLNISMGPGLLMALGLYIIYQLWSKQMIIKDAVLISLPVVVIVLFIAMYAFMIGKINGRYMPVSFVEMGDGIDLADFQFYKNIISVSLYNGIRVVISIGVFLLITFVYRKKLVADVSFFQLLFFLYAGILTSVLAFGLFYFNIDGFQVWSVPNASLSAILIFIIFIKLEEVRFMKAVSVFIIIACIYQGKVVYSMPEFTYKKFKYDKLFVSNILQQIHENKDGNFAFLYAPRPDVIWGGNLNMYYPYNFLKLYVDNYNPYWLSVYNSEYSNDPYVRSIQESFLTNAPFYRYVENQKKEGSFVTVENSQVHFIKAANIKYLVVEKGVIMPPPLYPLVKRTYTDRDNGNLFCVLSYNK